ncbi:MAG TPA: hypothetical protein VLV86_02835, partial [Vicinamibacterales bacterium]|nr:hypothetical protein [Vicinamibacterales bacterium]
MGSRIFTLATTVALAGILSTVASAQTPPLSSSQITVSCAPLPDVQFVPISAPRIMGSQDVVSRSTFGTPELLVVNAGASNGMQINQQYFVRRLFRTAETHTDKLPHMV